MFTHQLLRSAPQLFSIFLLVLAATLQPLPKRPWSRPGNGRRVVVSRNSTALAVLFALALLAVAGPCRAQATAPQARLYALGTSGVDPKTAPNTAIADQPSAPDAVPGGTVSISTGPDESNWHLAVAPYLWFPGVHGTIGALDRDANVHASSGDLLSHFRFGLMGVVEPRYKRLVLPVDFVWVRLADNNALPFPNLEAITANMKGSEFILTPKIGLRIVDLKALKIEALTGIRYWHFGESLQFTPSALGLNFSRSQNWVDPLIGGRIQATPLPRLEVTIAGDVGGWGAGSQLDYQVVGLLGYRLKPRWTLQVGYRYLDVNYRSGSTIIDTAMSGGVLGVSFAVIK
jgi:hypothetical protein